MLYAGLDLSRKRLDFHLLDDEGATVEVGAVAAGRRRPARPDASDSSRHGEPIRAVIESMNGARFVHDPSSWPAGRSRSPTRRR